MAKEGSKRGRGGREGGKGGIEGRGDWGDRGDCTDRVGVKKTEPSRDCEIATPNKLRH